MCSAAVNNEYPEKDCYTGYEAKTNHDKPV